MQKNLILFFFVSIAFQTVFAQENSDQTSSKIKKFINIEAGFIYPEGGIKESVSIRQNISDYYVNQYSNGSIFSQTDGFVFGIKYEYFFPKFKSGISSGLRFTSFNTDISGYTSSSSNFFYLRYSMQDSDTKFARVKSLTEFNYLLSVPLEVRVIPFHYKNLSFYATAGIEYSIASLNKGTDIKFQIDAMNEYKDEILSGVSGPTNKNYSTFYSSIGIKLGQEGKPNYMFEVLLPSVFLTSNNFALVNVNFYGGFKLAIQFPVNKNK
jgi:hypothetical protein